MRPDGGDRTRGEDDPGDGAVPVRGGGPDERLDSEGAVPELKRSGERAVRRGSAREAPIAGKEPEAR